jgi:tRNA uridine 5-carbamoylmethylation protein Kti12
MKNNKLIIFTGNIGCGKSTKALELAKLGYVVVNNDSIVTMIGGGDYSLYDISKKKIYINIENISVLSALTNNFNVVIDRTNMKKSTRERFINLGKALNAIIISYDWGPGRIQDLERRKLEPRIASTDWGEVYDRMHVEYEEPSFDEGFDKIYKISYNGEEKEVNNGSS